MLKDDLERADALLSRNFYDEEAGGGTGATGNRPLFPDAADPGQIGLEMIDYGKRVQMDDI